MESAMTKPGSLIPTRELRVHYNDELVWRMKREFSNVEISENIFRLVVRAQWGHDDPNPKRIVVVVKNIAGQNMRFNEKLYGFPTPELLAKLGLLL